MLLPEWPAQALYSFGQGSQAVTSKVFCIGFHKTGTTSLAVALKTLGYRVAGPKGVRDPNIAVNALAMAYALADQYDAFQDNPWPLIYKQLDARYPGSKFILTLRDSESWVKSQLQHFGRRETPMRKWIYGVGCPEGNEDVYVRRFEEHNREVMEYFKHRPEDLLILDLTKGDGWEKICPFLGRDVPDTPFPHANKARKREKARTLSARLAKKAKKLSDRIASYFA